MHGAAHYLPVFGKDSLDARLGDHSRVEIPDEDSGVEGARVILVGYVAGQALPGHPTVLGQCLLGTQTNATFKKTAEPRHFFTCTMTLV